MIYAIIAWLIFGALALAAILFDRIENNIDDLDG